MKKQFIFLAVLVIAILFICSSCKDSPNNPDVIKICDPSKCGSWTGQECVNGDCVCAKGKRRILGQCYGSDTTYLGVAKNTFWKDTVILTVYKKLTNVNYFTFDMYATDTKYGIGGPVGQTVAYRIKDTQGDSIHEANIADYNFFAPDGALLFPEFKGRILDSNTIRIKVTFCTHHNFGQINKRVDSTEYIFRKIQ